MTTKAKIGVVVAAVAAAALMVAALTTASTEAARLSAAAATFSALAAIVTASVSAGTLMQLRRDSRSTTRPQVGAWMRRGGGLGTIDFVVKNFGESIAHNVLVDIVGLPEWASDDPVIGDLARRYRARISTLVPDLELSNSYMHPDYAPVTQPPYRLTVHVSYTDDEGRPYSDTFDLDADLIRAESWTNQGEQ